MCMRVCVCEDVCVCVRVCACVRACVHMFMIGKGPMTDDKFIYVNILCFDVRCL